MSFSQHAQRNHSSPVQPPDSPPEVEPPIGAFVAIVLCSLAWLMMSSAEFPFSIVLALACLASPFIIGFLAVRLYRQRALSTTHRVAFYVCLAALVLVVFLLTVGPLGPGG